MCAPKSCIAFKSGIYFPLDIDSHSDMLEARGVRDDKPFPDFVKLEIYPDNKDLFDHDPAKWNLHVGQDRVPEWFDFDKAQKELREEHLPRWWKERFIVGRTVDEIKDGIWYLGTGGSVDDMHGGSVDDMRGGSVNTMRGGSVGSMWDGSVNTMWDGTVGSMRGGTVGSMRGGTVGSMRGGSVNTMRGGSVGSMRGGSVNTMWDGTVGSMRGGTVGSMHGGTVGSMRGGSVNTMRGGTVGSMRGGSVGSMHGGSVDDMHGGSVGSMWDGVICNRQGGTVINQYGGIVVSRSESKIYIPNDSAIVLIKADAPVRKFSTGDIIAPLPSAACYSITGLDMAKAEVLGALPKGDIRIKVMEHKNAHHVGTEWDVEESRFTALEASADEA